MYQLLKHCRASGFEECSQSAKSIWVSKGKVMLIGGTYGCTHAGHQRDGTALGLVDHSFRSFTGGEKRSVHIHIVQFPHPVSRVTRNVNSGR